MSRRHPDVRGVSVISFAPCCAATQLNFLLFDFDFQSSDPCEWVGLAEGCLPHNQVDKSAHSAIMDPLSLAASVAGLISLAQALIPLLVRFVDDFRSYPTEFADMLAEIRGLCGVLCLLEPAVQRPDGLQQSTSDSATTIMMAC